MERRCFRNRLVELWEVLEEVNSQLITHGLEPNTAAIVDATIIESQARPRLRWLKSIRIKNEIMHKGIRC